MSASDASLLSAAACRAWFSVPSLLASGIECSRSYAAVTDVTDERVPGKLDGLGASAAAAPPLTTRPNCSQWASSRRQSWRESSMRVYGFSKRPVLTMYSASTFEREGGTGRGERTRERESKREALQARSRRKTGSEASAANGFRV